MKPQCARLTGLKRRCGRIIRPQDYCVYSTRVAMLASRKVVSGGSAQQRFFSTSKGLYMRPIVLGLMLGLTPLAALAADKPTAEEAKKVLDFYYHGKGMGAVLVDTKVCRDIQR